MAEQKIRIGQIWASRDGKRKIRITAYNATWDDTTWANVENPKRRGNTYGSYLRKNYELVAEHA